MEYQIIVKEYEGSIPKRWEAWTLLDIEEQQRAMEEFPLHVRVRRARLKEGEEFSICMEARGRVERPISIALTGSKKDWKRKEYVFMPGAVYDGNRQKSRPIPYPPYYEGEESRQGVLAVTNILRLAPEEKRAELSLRSGDMTTPAMGFWEQETGKGTLFFARHQIGGEYTGFSVREEAGLGSFSVSLPAVREGKKYFFGELPGGSGFYPTCAVVSDDEGMCLEFGQRVELSVQCLKFAAATVEDYLAVFNEKRMTMEKGSDYQTIPFSRAYSAIKEKYQSWNFDPEGYFRVGSENEQAPSFWQAGWVGGGMNTLTFLVEDEGEAREKALSTLVFIVNHLQRENGWYFPMYARGKAFGDDFRDGSRSVLLVRKDADLLYFLLKQAEYLREHENYLKEQSESFSNFFVGISPGGLLPRLDASMEKQADAFVRFFEKNKELGQFIDMEKEEILQGGTASAAIAPAALALSYEYFGKKAYLETAEKLGELYLEQDLKKGRSNGGPGEILQAPDSESAFALLESYVQLYETTGKEEWLKAARAAFELAITWVMSYDFSFPKGSTAALLKAHTRGTVFANAQNKHSAPGICTLSGNSILKLYRFTGEERFLSWLFYISHAIPQFVSLKERPVFTLAGKYLIPGNANERVQTSDWEGKETIGEFLYGDNWPAVSMMLTYAEVPGVYVDQKRGLVKCFDHVKAWWEGEGCLVIHNPTQYDACVTVFLDNGEGKLGACYFDKMQKVSIKAGETGCIMVSGKEKFCGCRK